MSEFLWLMEHARGPRAQPKLILYRVCGLEFKQIKQQFYVKHKTPYRCSLWRTSAKDVKRVVCNDEIEICVGNIDNGHLFNFNTNHFILFFSRMAYVIA